MLYRKIGDFIRTYLKSSDDKVLLVEGARQIGKSFIIRHVGSELFPNFIEINFAEDNAGPQFYKNIHSVNDFYLQLSAKFGNAMGDKDNTLVFLDEIQEYPQFLTLLKFLRQENRYRYVASGSLLGITLRQTTSIPIGSILVKDMYPLDFEEFMIANGWGEDIRRHLREQFYAGEPLSEPLHKSALDLFKKYLITGGMPDAVNQYLADRNVAKIRAIQRDIINLYKVDASKYDSEHRLHIRRIYDLIPSAMENKKKRLMAIDIEGQKGARFSKYAEDYEYLVSSGIALSVQSVSNPKFPLLESTTRNLTKLYLNDVGLLSCLFFSDNIKPILDTVRSINLGALYETVVAQELKTRMPQLYYYDNKKNGEVDFLVDDFANLTVLPIEVKSGKDYNVHSSLSRFISTPDYGIKQAIVLSNEREISSHNGITYLPVYYIPWIAGETQAVPTLL